MMHPTRSETESGRAGQDAGKPKRCRATFVRRVGWPLAPAQQVEEFPAVLRSVGEEVRFGALSVVLSRLCHSIALQVPVQHVFGHGIDAQRIESEAPPGSPA